MKTKVSRTIAVLLLAAFGFTSCSTQYRERRHHRQDNRTTERVIIRNN